MHVVKTEIVAELHSRGLNDRADFVDRELPRIVDTEKNGSLLRMLGVDPTSMSSRGAAAQPS